MHRFALHPLWGRSQLVGVLVFPVVFAFTGVSLAIDDGRAWVIALASLVGLVVLAVVAWAWRRVAPSVLVIEGDVLVLVLDTRAETLRGDRRELRAEVGYTQVSGRNTGGVKYRAIAFTVAGRRLVVQSARGGDAPGGRRLAGQVYMVPAARFDRLCELLRLRPAAR